MQRARLAWLVVVGVVAGWGASAQAATPFNIGNGIRPSATVDGAGNGYFAWIEERQENAAAPALVRFCKVPVGGTSCSVSSSFPVPTNNGLYLHEAAGFPQVFLLSNGQPTIFTACRACVFGGDAGVQWVSADGGASFQPRPGYAPLGLIGYVAGRGRSAFDPVANQVFGIDYDGEFQRMPVADPSGYPPTSAQLSPFAPGSRDDAAVTYIGSGPTQTQVAALVGRMTGTELRFKYHTGASDPNVAGNWTGGDSPIGTAHRAALATGASGIVLLSARESGPSTVEARRFSDATKSFGAATTIASEGQGEGFIYEVDLSQAANGRLHALWRTPFGGTVQPGARYSTSADGVTWSAPQSIVADPNMYSARIAGLNDANKGWMVYANNDISDNAIRVATLDPLPPPPPPPAPPPPVAPPPPPPPAISPNFTGATKAVTVSDRYASYSFTVPRACVQPGQTFTATLKWKRKKRKGNVFVKVTRVDFYRDKTRLRIDRKAPFVYRYKIVATTRRGSTIKLRARAFTKVRRGRAPTKSLRAEIKVCN